MNGNAPNGSDVTVEQAVGAKNGESAVVRQNDLRAVKEVLQAEIGRLYDDRHVACTQLHIAAGESPGVQYMNYSCVYILQARPKAHYQCYSLA